MVVVFAGPSVLTLKDPSKVGEERVEDMIGVIKHYGPVHSKYATIEARLRTFRDWPPGLKQQPKDLAESGFYYMGKRVGYLFSRLQVTTCFA